jgi:excisionase family DNA binding protein
MSKIKFSDLEELNIWLRQKNHLKHRYNSENKYVFYDQGFKDLENLYNWLEFHSIIEIVKRPKVVMKVTENNLYQIFSHYEYDIENIYLNENNLKSLIDEKFIDQIINNRLLTIRQVCEILGVTKPSVYKIFASGELKYYEILSQRKVLYSDLVEFLKKRKQ